MEQRVHTVTVSKYSGSHSEIGQKLGRHAREKFGPQYIDNALATLKGSFLYKALGMSFDLSPAYIDRAFPVVEGIIKRVHPNLLDEIQGFAEGLGENYRKLLVFTNNFGNETGCSQFFLNGYLARNYDDSPDAVENEFLLISPTGNFASFGASSAYFGRLDGMNEKGLVVSLTFGAGHPPRGAGIAADTFQRIVLDKTATVDEALDIFDQIPYVTPNNVMIADALGNAVVIEMSGAKHSIRIIEEGILICANSYLDSQMKDQQKIKNPTSAWREQQMQGMSFGSVAEMMDFLTTDFPNGLFEPYYADGLGTLWSVIYHPQSRGIYLAIGEGTQRKEVRFNLNDPSTLENLPQTLKTQLKNVNLLERIPRYR